MPAYGPIQSGGTASGTAAASRAFTLNGVKSGETLVVVGTVNGSTPTMTLSSSPALTWVNVASATTPNLLRLYVAYAVPAGDYTVTLTINDATHFPSLCGGSWQNLPASAFDASNTATGTAVGVASAATATLAQADELIIGGYTEGGSTTTTATPTGTYANFPTVFPNDSTQWPVVAEWKSVTATTGVASGWTLNASGGTWQTLVATFKANAARLPRAALVRQDQAALTTWG